jgi:hypothetical protein
MSAIPHVNEIFDPVKALSPVIITQDMLDYFNY